MKRITLLINIVLSLVILLSGQISYAGIDEFDINNSIVDIDSFLSGGPAKDGIPALTNPKFLKAEKAKYLKDDDLIIGLNLKGETKAYPIQILNWHEIVNDNFLETPVAVTFCPLTKSAVVFDRRIEGKILEFGVSGLLYKSNVVMYDRSNNALWSQLYNGSLTGELSSKKLKLVPSLVTTWGQWSQRYPETLVLSRKTGHWRHYDFDPYQSYHESDQTMFNVDLQDSRLNEKELIIGIRINNESKAYPLSKINRLDEPLKDKIAGINIKVYPGNKDKNSYITDTKGELLPAYVVYWFAWRAFNQDTKIYLD